MVNFQILGIQDYYEESQIQFGAASLLKIVLINQDFLYYDAGKSIQISGRALMFFNSTRPYRFELLSTKTKGIVCIFCEPFFGESYTKTIRDLPVFDSNNMPYYHLNKPRSKCNSNIVYMHTDTLTAYYIRCCYFPDYKFVPPVSSIR